MKGCKMFSFVILMALNVLTSNHEHRSASIFTLKGNDVKRNIMYKPSFLREKQWSLRFENKTSGSTESKSVEKMLTSDQFVSPRRKEPHAHKLIFGNLGHYNAIDDFMERKQLIKSIINRNTLKNQQNTINTQSTREKRNDENEKSNRTEIFVWCPDGVAVHCRTCYECCGRNFTNSCATTAKSEEVFTCQCDYLCAFYNDCCDDYMTFCKQTQNISSLAIDQGTLSCTIPAHVDTGSHFGNIWMVNKCPRKSDEVARNCELADEMELNITNLQHLVPVVDKHNVTFRNEFCAKCNGIEEFEYFGFDIKCYLAPPPYVTLFEDLVEFALKYCEQKEGMSIFIKDDQPVRNCLPHSRRRKREESGEECVEHQNHKPKHSITPFTVALRLSRGSSNVQVRKIACPRNHFYDRYLKTCREGEDIPPVKENLDKFAVVVWLRVSRTSQPTLNETISSLANLFHFQLSKVSSLRRKTIHNSYKSTAVISFELALTNEQTLRLGNSNYTKTNDTASNVPNNLTNASLPLKKLLFFSSKFKVKISNRTFTVFKTTSRQLACIRKKTYPQGSYASIENGKYFYINSIDKTFPRSQVFFNESATNNGISVCELIVFSTCEGQRIRLTSKEYVKFDNLSIFYHRTNKMYDFGQYDIEDGRIVMCIKENPPMQFVLKPFLTERYLTLVCFVLSLTSLFLVIQTYVIFQELRNLPGKNILNLSVSLFLAQLLWLVPGYTNAICYAVAVLKHYLFLVSFVAMATIAWETHLVFASENVSRRDSCKKKENKKFCKYFVNVWGLPAIFVCACVVVDKKDIYAVYVNRTLCWFDDEQVQRYLFVLPIGVLLLFNVIFFVSTVFRIQRIRYSTRMVADQNPRTMFWIHLKLSSLMGFTWLFGFVDLLVDATSIFSYLFLIFASLQGLYIALAFVMKKEIWEKYKKLLRIQGHKKFQPDYHSTLVEDLSNSKETKV